MEDNKQLAVQTNPYLGLALSEIQKIATVLAASGIFKDATEAKIAFAKVLAGQEMGLTPFKAMQELSFINGKPNLSANAKAAAIKAHPRYDYRVLELDTTHCVIEFFQDGKSVGRAEHNEALAKTGGEYTRNPNYKTHPDDMYFAGALRKGQRRYCPDATNGISTYDPEEFTERPVIEVAEESLPKSMKTPTQAEIIADQEASNARIVAAAPGEHLAPDEPNPAAKADPKQIRRIMAMLKDKGVTDPNMQKHVVYEFGDVESRTELTVETAERVINAIDLATTDDLNNAAYKHMAAPEPADEPF